MVFLRYSVVSASIIVVYLVYVMFCFQAEDGIRDLVRSRGLGDVYKRQASKGDGWSLHFLRCVFDGRGRRGRQAGKRSQADGLSLIHI